MSEETYTSETEEDFHKVLTHVLQERAKELERVFSEVTLSVDISSSSGSSLDAKFRWAGNFDLIDFVENLPKLKSKAPQVYAFMFDGYGDIIDKGKRLIAKLKLQELPIPNVQVVYHNFDEPEMKYKVYTPGEKNTWVHENYGSGADSEFQLNRYLTTERLILADICEVLTRTFYVYLTATLEGVKSVAKEKVWLKN